MKIVYGLLKKEMGGNMEKRFIVGITIFCIVFIVIMAFIAFMPNISAKGNTKQNFIEQGDKYLQRAIESKFISHAEANSNLAIAHYLRAILEDK